MSEDNLLPDGTPAPTSYPVHIASDVFWYDDGLAMDGVYYVDCGVASELPAALWSEQELLYVVNHMRKRRGADPIVPTDAQTIAATLLAVSAHLTVTKYSATAEDKLFSVEKVLFDIADEIRRGKAAEQFWTQPIVPIQPAFSGTPDMDLWLDPGDIWEEYPPTDPPKDSHD